MLTFLLVKWQLWSSWSELVLLCMLYAHIPFVFKTLPQKKRKAKNRFSTFMRNQIKPKNKNSPRNQSMEPNKPNQPKETKKPNHWKTNQETKTLKKTHSKPHQRELIRYVSSSGVSKIDLAGQWLSDMTQVVEPVIKWFVLWQFSTGQF